MGGQSVGKNVGIKMAHTDHVSRSWTNSFMEQGGLSLSSRDCRILRSVAG